MQREVITPDQFQALLSLPETQLLVKIGRGVHCRVTNESELPALPNNFEWNREMGGLILMPAKDQTYRLWSSKLGYMPGAE